MAKIKKFGVGMSYYIDKITELYSKRGYKVIQLNNSIFELSYNYNDINGG